MSPQLDRRGAGLKVTVLAREAMLAAEAVLKDATAAVRARVGVENHDVERRFAREQRATHGLAWLATYVEAIRQLCAYAERMHGTGDLGETEELLVQIGLGEYLAQIVGGIPMSQSEIVRPADLGLSARAVAQRMAGPLEGLILGNEERRARLVASMCSQTQGTVGVTVGDCGLDETFASIRDEMHKFADSEIVPQAHAWHLSNSVIPLDVVAQMSELGVFGHLRHDVERD